jgi:F-type H+-transporting ATPase subunit b
MISLDISILYQIIIFLVLWLILSKVMFRPYLDLLDERERKTTGAIYDTSALESEGARLKAEYEGKIAEAKSAGTAAKEAIIQEGRRERERLVQQARGEAAILISNERREIQSELERNRNLATAEAGDIAQDMVGKILGRRVG